MSMFVPRISAYQQLQDWRAGQSNINSQIFGANGAGSTDFSSAFTDVANNTYTNQATLAANQALSRVQQQAGTTPSSTTSTTTTGDQRLAAAQAAGKAALSSLGLDPSTLFPSTANSSKTPSSGPYQAPTNSATGYAYVATSAANLNALNAVNILA
jgi:hypothetical protein